MYNDRAPITGNNDDPKGDNDGKKHNMTIPGCPREKFTGIPRFVTVKGGGYFFLPLSLYPTSWRAIAQPSLHMLIGDVCWKVEIRCLVSTLYNKIKGSVRVR
ncbi:hypothetical protein [Mucilaginibacter sp.]|jgi:hypothetical protein|uniref:hypothetical protein n=1 Tax=Mucilaginibacter sp. TaxID=1882438 RepID=UPI002B5D470D|nr:hypothetical protein [Mucilaginibacter sp.]HTI58048.1 hypothetical protein [Mucilaginibacter sp.]